MRVADHGKLIGETFRIQPLLGRPTGRTAGIKWHTGLPADRWILGIVLIVLIVLGLR